MFELAREKGFFTVFSSLADGFGAALRSHSILLISHPSLRFGEADYVISHFARKGGLHVLYSIDPNFVAAEAVFAEGPVMQHFLVNREYIRVGLSLGNILGLLEEFTGRKVLVPECFSIDNPKVSGYAESLRVEVFPCYAKLHSNLGLQGPVRGKLVLQDYNRHILLTDRVESIKTHLKSLGYEVIVAHYNSYSSLKVLGGELVFRAKRTEVRGKNPDIRSALLSFLHH